MADLHEFKTTITPELRRQAEQITGTRLWDAQLEIYSKVLTKAQGLPKHLLIGTPTGLNYYDQAMSDTKKSPDYAFRTVYDDVDKLPSLSSCRALYPEGMHYFCEVRAGGKGTDPEKRFMSGSGIWLPYSSTSIAARYRRRAILVDNPRTVSYAQQQGQQSVWVGHVFCALTPKQLREKFPCATYAFGVGHITGNIYALHLQNKAGEWQGFAPGSWVDEAMVACPQVPKEYKERDAKKRNEWHPPPVFDHRDLKPSYYEPGITTGSPLASPDTTTGSPLVSPHMVWYVPMCPEGSEVTNEILEAAKDATQRRDVWSMTFDDALHRSFPTRRNNTTYAQWVRQQSKHRMPDDQEPNRFNNLSTNG